MLLAGVRSYDTMGHGSSLRQREVRRWPQGQGKTAYSRYGGSGVYTAHGYSVQALWAVYWMLLLAGVRSYDTMGHGSFMGQREVRRWPQDQGKTEYSMYGGRSWVYRAHGYSVQVLWAVYWMLLLAGVRARNTMGYGSSLGQRDVRRLPQDQGKNGILDVCRAVRGIRGPWVQCASAVGGLLDGAAGWSSSM